MRLITCKMACCRESAPSPAKPTATANSGSGATGLDCLSCLIGMPTTRLILAPRTRSQARSATSRVDLQCSETSELDLLKTRTRRDSSSLEPRSGIGILSSMHRGDVAVAFARRKRQPVLLVCSSQAYDQGGVNTMMKASNTPTTASPG
jgi:hypothetical protein